MWVEYLHTRKQTVIRTQVELVRQSWGKHRCRRWGWLQWSRPGPTHTVVAVSAHVWRRIKYGLVIWAVSCENEPEDCLLSRERWQIWLQLKWHKRTESVSSACWIAEELGGPQLFGLGATIQMTRLNIKYIFTHINRTYCTLYMTLQFGVNACNCMGQYKYKITHYHTHYF